MTFTYADVRLSLARGGEVAYRDIQRPNPFPKYINEWVEWADAEGLLSTVRGDEHGVCDLCYGVTGIRSDGDHFWSCYSCSSLRAYLSALVPISYSVPSGLEALIWRQKNDGQSARWMSLPMASIVWTFLRDHLDHIEQRLGHIDVFAMVPSSPQSRGGWDHLRSVVEGIDIATWASIGVTWEPALLTKSGGSSAGTRRGSIDPDLFELTDPDADLDGKTVLLFDDTFTEGGTLASAALPIVKGGAAKVVGLTLGRQLNAAYNQTAADLVASLPARGYDPGRCVLDVE